MSAGASPQRLGGVHDLVSGTRVVARAAVGERRWRISAGDAAAESPQPNALTGRRYGPFVVVSEAGETGSGRLFVAFDPVLRRLVWVLATPVGTPPVSVARRDVSRRGRLYWLAGRRTDQESWDAFEAPDGAAFSRPSSVTPDWSALKPWLIDLANELNAAQMDGTVPALGLERLWIRNDGRLVLLDFAAPGSTVSDGARAPASLKLRIQGRARHPSVSPDQLAQATQIIAPELARFNESDDSKGGGLRAGGATLVTTLISISVGFVLVCSLISSMLAPGGVVTRLQGLAVVSRSGIEIARWRSFVRTLVAWSPSIAWIAFLITSPRIQGFVPAPSAPILAMSLALGAQVIGALGTIARPVRGVHDWIAGTWVVPR